MKLRICEHANLVSCEVHNVLTYEVMKFTS